ncbi:MAG: hypothetical protein MUC57_04190 [Desulfobacterales bacterium]|jgi:hypothetical protein|nr:hypothetical protein [Desulfobacterales bacterium]
MPILNLEDVKPGMTLAQAVRNHQDQLLLDGGRRITEKSIRVFKSWGIRRVAVNGGPAGDGAEDGGRVPGLPPDIDAELRERFSDVATDPLMTAILQAAARQLAVRQPKKKTGYGRR